MKKSNAAASIAILASLFCFSVHADTVAYEDALAGTGECVDYLDISEDATVDTGGSGLFGTPTRDGDSLVFNPQGFDTGAVTGPGSNLVDSHVETTICLSEGFPSNGIVSIDLSEFGDYTVAGSGEVTASINWFLNIPGASGVAAGTSMFTATSGTGPWQLGVELDLVNGTYDSGSGAMPFTDANGGAITLPDDLLQCVTFEFDNTLVARAFDATSSAFIKKKGTGGVVIDTTTDKAIPEPGAFALALVGCLGLMGVSRRSRG